MAAQKQLLELGFPIATDEFFLTNDNKALVHEPGTGLTIDVYDVGKYLTCLRQQQAPLQCMKTGSYQIPYFHRNLQKYLKLTKVKLVDVNKSVADNGGHTFLVELTTDSGVYYRLHSVSYQFKGSNYDEPVISNVWSTFLTSYGMARFIDDTSFVYLDGRSDSYKIIMFESNEILSSGGLFVLGTSVYNQFPKNSPYGILLKNANFFIDADGISILYHNRFYDNRTIASRSSNENTILYHNFAFDAGSEIYIDLYTAGDYVLKKWKDGATQEQRLSFKPAHPTNPDRNFDDDYLLIPSCVVGSDIVYYVIDRPQPYQPDIDTPAARAKIRYLYILHTQRNNTVDMIAFRPEQQPEIGYDQRNPILSSTNILNNLYYAPLLYPHDPKLLAIAGGKSAHSAGNEYLFLINLATKDVWYSKDPANQQIQTLRISNDGIVQADKRLFYMDQHSVETLRYETGQLAKRRRAFHRALGADDVLGEERTGRSRLPLELREMIARGMI